MDRRHLLTKIVKKFDPDFKEKWVIYENILKKILEKDGIWIDIGCGKNGEVWEYHDLCGFAAGMDLHSHPERNAAPFFIGKIENLPIKDNSIQLITLRFVVEHLKYIAVSFNELKRILKTNGKILIITPNSFSPFIMVSRIIPHTIKTFLLQKLFKENSEDIFPAYHKFNTPYVMKKPIKNLNLEKLIFIQDVIFSNIFVFFIFLIWFLITKKLKKLEIFKTSIIAIYKKCEN